jgi:hypothetical protein
MRRAFNIAFLVRGAKDCALTTKLLNYIESGRLAIIKRWSRAGLRSDRMVLQLYFSAKPAPTNNYGCLMGFDITQLFGGVYGSDVGFFVISKWFPGGLLGCH